MIGLYYEIWDIEDPKNSLFDTLRQVAKECDMSYENFLYSIGFVNDMEIRSLMVHPPTNHYSVQQVLVTRMNYILRELGSPIRVVRKRKRVLQNGSRID